MNALLENKTVLLVLPLVLSQVVQYFVPMMDNWYDSLNRSPLTPPGWVFGVVWTILYLIIGYSLGLGLVGTQWLWASLILGFVWQYVFNGQQNIRGGLMVLLAVTATAYQYYRLSGNQLILPYLAWGVFASYLNGYLAINN